MTAPSINTSVDESSIDSLNINRYWTRTNFGLSMSYDFIKKYFLRDVICKRSLKMYKTVKSYQNERKRFMPPILKDFIDKEVYTTVKKIEKPYYAVTLSFKNDELMVIGPLCKTKVQAKVEGSMTLFKIIYHFNCRLLPFVEGNANLINKFNSTLNSNNISKNNESSLDCPVTFSHNGWEEISPEYDCFENLCHPKNLFYVSLIDFLNDSMMDFIDPGTGAKKRMYIGYLTKKPAPHIINNFVCYSGTNKTSFSLTSWDKFHNNHTEEEIHALQEHLQSTFGFKTIVKKNSDIQRDMSKEDFIIDNSECQCFLPVYFNDTELSRIKKFQSKLWGLLCISLEFKFNNPTEDMYYIIPFFKSLDKNSNGKINVDWHFINQTLQEKPNPDNLTVADWMVTVDYLIRNGQKELISKSKNYEEKYKIINTTFKKLNEDATFRKKCKSRTLSKESCEFISDTLMNSYYRTSYNHRVYRYFKVSDYITMDDTLTIDHRDEDPYETTYKDYIMSIYLNNYEFKYDNLPLISGKVFSLLKNFEYRSEKELELMHKQQEEKSKNKKKHSSSGYKIWFIPELCYVFLLPIHWQKFLQFIPILTYKLKSYCYMDEFRYEIGLRHLTVDSLLSACTFKTSDIIMGNRHERLELLGDTVLKYFTSLDLLNRFPNKDEAGLTQERMDRVSNEHLIKLINSLDWQRFFLKKKFSIGYFCPPNVVIIEGSRLKEGIEDNRDSKPKADFYESIIGACFVDGQSIQQSIQLCKLFLQRTGVLSTIKYKWKPHHDHLIDVKNFDYDHAVEHICTSLHHQYSEDSSIYPVLHIISSTDSTKQREYQRLEFLGDAVIDLITVLHFYNRFNTADPKHLTQYKHISVQNQIFADLLINLGIINDIPPNSKSSEVKQYIEKRKTQTVQAPKYIADLFEVLVGALHIDNQYHFVKTNSELLKLLTKHIFDKAALSQSVERFEVINECLQTLSLIARKYSYLDGFIHNPRSIYKSTKISNSETSCCIHVQFRETEIVPLTEFTCTGNNIKIAKRKTAQSIMNYYHNLGEEDFEARLIERITKPNDRKYTLDFWEK